MKTRLKDVQTKDRDRDRCLLTNRGPRDAVQACHIYPHSALQENGPVGFWGTLKQFWTDERISRWESAILNEDRKYFDGCHNMLTLLPTVHTDWNRGAFALKPLPAIGTAEVEGFAVRVQLFWQPYYNKTSGNLKLTEQPDLAQKDRSGEVKIFRNKYRIESGRPVPDEYVVIETGHVFEFTTPDPNKLRLPNRHLLEMQWMLQRVRAMRGSADDNDDEDNDDDRADVDKMASVEPWLDSIPLPDSQMTTTPVLGSKIASH